MSRLSAYPLPPDATQVVNGVVYKSEAEAAGSVCAGCVAENHRAMCSTLSRAGCHGVVWVREGIQSRIPTTPNHRRTNPK